MTLTRRISSGAASAAFEFMRSAYRFVFPPACPLCGADMTSLTILAERRRVTPVLCSDCVAAVRQKSENSCIRCGVPLGPYVSSQDGCLNCRARNFRFDRVIRFGLYEGRLREAVIFAKSPRAQPLSAALANQFWIDRRELLSAEGIDVVAPVPRYWTRRLWHDHNQSETLARVLARLLRVRFGRTLLHKMRLTPDQSDLSAADRKRNLRNAFSVWLGRWSLPGKTVLLVDDILTTGTTASECAKTLLRAGAKRVIVAVIAVAPPPRR